MMVTTVETDIGTLIHRRPGLNGGRPCLAGTGMSVHQIAVEYTSGAAPEEILRRYPHLDLARIHAGITYYFANRAWLDVEIEEEVLAYQREVERRRRERTAG